MTEELPAITIRNEDDAFHYLQDALENKLGDDAGRLEFKNWPVISISLTGDGYDSTITSRMAEALVELQHTMNRTYAYAAHGSTNPNTLTLDEKRQVQFKAKVEKGSSLINIDLGEYAEKLSIALAGKMDGNQIALTVLGIALLSAGTLAYKAFLRHRSEDKKVAQATQERVALSQEETKRMGLMTQAMAQVPHLATTRQDFDDVRHEIIKSVSDATSLKVQGVTLTNAEARSIALTPRTKAEDVQLNGHYMIHKIDWSRQEEARLSLYSTEETREFSANLNTATLRPEHLEMLKTSEWDRKKIYMSINATKLRGEVTTARIVGVDWPKDVQNPAPPPG